MTNQTFHFIGLGGIGMSALARILLQRGSKVQGSDAHSSPLLEDLKREGAKVRIGHSPEGIEGSAIVYSSAVKESNVELSKAKELKLPLFHRSDLLHHLMKEKKPLLVTGTHGKTTTTSLLAAVLLEAKTHPSFVIGGILQSLKTNGLWGEGPYFIAEADESDGSFLKTESFGAIVTNLENDHLDYWSTAEALNQAFSRFFSQVKNPKHLFWCGDDPRLCSLAPPGFSYGFSEGVDLQILNYRMTDLGISFDFSFQGKEYSKIELSLLGRHNALNGAAVFGLCLSLQIPEADIRKAFQEFKGTARRLELKGETRKVKLFDDYGHHPTEIAATLSALRDRIRERRLVVVFQPHRFTRVRDFFEEFIHCFNEADEIILTDIYSAGEAPIEGITTAALYSRMREKLGSKLHYVDRRHLEEGVVDFLKPLDIVLTIGAGDITKAGELILKKYGERGMKITVGVLCGGRSVEHDISLMSARNIVRSLDRSLYDLQIFGVTKGGEWISGGDTIDRLEQKICCASNSKISPQILSELLKCDVCIPVFHGPEGEDGMMQGLLDALSIPYVGCDYRGSALCMQKAWTKQSAILNHIPTAPYVEIDASTYRKDPEGFIKKIEEKLTYPIWVKAVHLGSSLGVSRVVCRGEVAKAVEHSFTHDDVLIAEQEIEGRQIEFAVMGNEYVRVAVPCEILSHGAFYDFDKKYGPSASGVDIPPKISEIERQTGQDLAEKAYRAAGCKGLARVDFFLDKSGRYWLNEINPFPGFTNTSGYPKMWEASGLDSTALMDEFIALAFHRTRRLAEIRGK